MGSFYILKNFDMQKQEFLEKMVHFNHQQMELSQEMSEVLVLHLKLFKTYNTRVNSLIQFIQNNNNNPLEITNYMLANFADLKDNYHLFFTQCSENLIKQMKISKESTIALSHEYSEGS